MPYPDAFKALEGFNLGICALSGAELESDATPGRPHRAFIAGLRAFHGRL